jgi:hypothetical protein
MNAQSLTAPMVSGFDPMQAAMATPLQPAPLPLVPVGGKAVANRVKILFTKMGSEGDLIGSANSIQINPSLLMA